MKTAKVILLLFALSLWACEDSEQVEQVGCNVGYRNGVKTLVRCCTYKEYLAGDNVSKGGVSYFGNYTNHTWIKVAICKECDKYK